MFLIIFNHFRNENGYWLCQEKAIFIIIRKKRKNRLFNKILSPNEQQQQKGFFIVEKVQSNFFPNTIINNHFGEYSIEKNDHFWPKQNNRQKPQ